MEIPNPPDPRSPIRHRAPILCVDRILEASDEHSVCEYDVREGPHVDQGHLWEPALVEGLAQTAAVMQAHTRRGGTQAAQLRVPEGLGMLVGLRKFEALRSPRVGERVTWRVDVIKRLGPYLLVAGSARCAGELVARGELKFFWEDGS